MQVISKKTIADTMILEALAELHKANETIRLYEIKYGASLPRLEQRIQDESEDFECYDDIIDWKATLKWRDELLLRMDELKHGHFKVA